MCRCCLLYRQSTSLKVWKPETPVLRINSAAYTHIAFLNYWVFDVIVSSIQEPVCQVPKTFRTRETICKPANRLFRKADLLTCFQGKKRQTNCEVWRLKSFPFLRYRGNCCRRKWLVKFRDFRETGSSSLNILKLIMVDHWIGKFQLQ